MKTPNVHAEFDSVLELMEFIDPSSVDEQTSEIINQTHNYIKNALHVPYVSDNNVNTFIQYLIDNESKHEGFTVTEQQVVYQCASRLIRISLGRDKTLHDRCRQMLNYLDKDDNSSFNSLFEDIILFSQDKFDSLLYIFEHHKHYFLDAISKNIMNDAQKLACAAQIISFAKEHDLFSQPSFDEVRYISVSRYNMLKADTETVCSLMSKLCAMTLQIKTENLLVDKSTVSFLLTLNNYFAQIPDDCAWLNTKEKRVVENTINLLDNLGKSIIGSNYNKVKSLGLSLGLLKSEAFWLSNMNDFEITPAITTIYD